MDRVMSKLFLTAIAFSLIIPLALSQVTQAVTSECLPIIRNDLTEEKFTSVQAAVDDPNAVDFDTIQLTVGDFEEDIIYDRNIILTLSGGYYCDFSDNPSASSINSLTVRDGTIIAEKIVVKSQPKVVDLQQCLQTCENGYGQAYSIALERVAYCAAQLEYWMSQSPVNMDEVIRAHYEYMRALAQAEALLDKLEQCRDSCYSQAG